MAQRHHNQTDRPLAANRISRLFSLRNAVILLLAAFLAVGTAWQWRNDLWQWFQEFRQILEHREVFRDFIISMGPLASLAFISIQVLQIIISPIPGEATGFIGGFLFGTWMGFIYSSIGLTLGSALAFFISRFFRHIARSYLARSDLYEKFEHLVEHQGLFVIFFLFVFPGFPKDFLCYLLGLSRMPWQAFLLICAVGRMPGTLMLTLQGANIYDGDIRGFLLVLLATAAIAGPAWYFRDRIYTWVEAHSLRDEI